MAGNEESGREHKDPEKMTMDDLGEAIDKDSMRIGLTVADIFKTLSLAMSVLPNMELKTDSMDLTVFNDGISVALRLPKKPLTDSGFEGADERGHNNDDYDEEGLLYDGD